MRNILSLILCLLLFSCSKIEVNPTYTNTPQGNYDALTTEFQNRYALFGVKNINWAQLKDQYRSKVTANSSAHELYTVLTQLLGNLNDNHVHLIAADEPKFMAGTLNQKPAFSDSRYADLNKDIELFGKNIRENYMGTTNDFEIPEANAFYGTVKTTKANKKAGYVYVGNWHISDTKSFKEAMDKVILSLSDVDGIIIDERFNYGGFMENAVDLASRFTDHPIPFATSSTKNGPGIYDFTAPETWVINPATIRIIGKPVILLTNGHSLSASDIFAMAMKNIPNVKQVGETTSGAFAESITKEMPNGWTYAISASITKSIEGISYEGIGIKPAIEVSTTKADLINRKDKQLDKAIEELTQNW